MRLQKTLTTKNSVLLRGVFVLPMLVFVLTSPASAGPLELIQDIYGNYPPSELPSNWHKAKENLPSISALPLSLELLALWNRWNKANPGDICIDVDPVSDSQDPAVELYRILNFSNSVVQIEIKSNYSSGVRQSKVTYSIKNENGRWVVDDVGEIKKDLKKCLLHSH